MEPALKLFAMALLSTFCLIQAAGQHDRARLSVKLVSSPEPEEAQVVFSPSLAPSPPYPDFVPQNSARTVPPAPNNPNPQETFSPFLSSTSPCNPAFTNKPSKPLSFRVTSINRDTFGSVGVESYLFHRTCDRFCEVLSKRRCWIVKKARFHSRCKSRAFLGTKDAPSCCFYIHCLKSRRPFGRRSSWWKYIRLLRYLRRSCKF